MNAAKPTILNLQHAPRIARAGPTPVDFIVLADKSGHREMCRHWDKDLQATTPCDCKGLCDTRRTDHFISGLLWFAPHTWEQVVLHFSDLAWTLLHNLLEVHQTQLLGVWGTWQRRSAAANSGVVIKLHGDSKCRHSPVDVGYVLQRRLGISSDFFGDHQDSISQEAAPASLAEIKGHAERPSKSEKPRVPKGKRR